jgi:hypothetical protein
MVDGVALNAGVLAPARFVRRCLDDQISSRALFFRELRAVASPCPQALVFFDPDIGLAAKTKRKGVKGSSMYVFPDEIAETFQLGHSLVIYQHFPREQRDAFLSRTLASLRDVCGTSSAFALWSSRVAFLIVPQEPALGRFADACQEIVSRWRPQIAFHPGNDVRGREAGLAPPQGAA